MCSRFPALPRTSIASARYGRSCAARRALHSGTGADTPSKEVPSMPSVTDRHAEGRAASRLRRKPATSPLSLLPYSRIHQANNSPDAGHPLSGWAGRAWAIFRVVAPLPILFRRPFLARRHLAAHRDLIDRFLLGPPTWKVRARGAEREEPAARRRSFTGSRSCAGAPRARPRCGCCHARPDGRRRGAPAPAPRRRRGPARPPRRDRGASTAECGR